MHHAQTLLALCTAMAAAALSGCVAATDESEPPGESAASEGAEASPWGCYNPQPGHPTTAEKTAWIGEVATYAEEAEAVHGVPAAAILAMTANEGGYGWTRTALYANNAFGWKWTSSAAAGGRGYYTLACQPSWDPNNKYVKFADARDGILFVSEKLATLSSSWANYKAATDRYKQDRQGGVDVVTAVNRWIDGIADAGYNYDPPSYKAKLKKTANNYMTPSTAYSEQYNLYRYSTGGGGGGGVWISIDSPADGATVSGTVPFRASVGGGAVTSVKLYSRAAGSMGDWYLITTDTAAPYGVDWATDPWVANGDYDLKAEAWDGATKQATGVFRVTVVN